MRIPKTFLPENDLEKKVKKFLKQDKHTKSEEEEDYAKRKILVHSNDDIDYASDIIYVFVKRPKVKKGYLLNAKSLYKFFYPLSGSNHAPALLGKKNVTAYVRNEDMLIEYLNSLRFLNDGRLAWGGDRYIQKLKGEYEGWEDFIKLVTCKDEDS